MSIGSCRTLRKHIGSAGGALAAAAVLLVWTVPNARAEPASPAKAKVVMKGHPEKQHTAVVVPQVTKVQPAPKVEKAPKAPRPDVVWVPGDYYWAGDDWAWDEGYWLDRAWSDATWSPGHWAQRWWGWTWVSGYWF
jgi:hypothetical protein